MPELSGAEQSKVNFRSWQRVGHLKAICFLAVFDKASVNQTCIGYVRKTYRFWYISRRSYRGNLILSYNSRDRHEPNCPSLSSFRMHRGRVCGIEPNGIARTYVSATTVARQNQTITIFSRTVMMFRDQISLSSIATACYFTDVHISPRCAVRPSTREAHRWQSAFKHLAGVTLRVRRSGFAFS